MELRRALYWLNEGVKEQLYPENIEKWDQIPRMGKTTSLDFVSYLAIVCDYYSTRSPNKVDAMKGCHRGNKKWKGTTRFEDYVTDFISAMVTPGEAKRWSTEYLEKIIPKKFETFKMVFDKIEQIKNPKDANKTPLQFENQVEADFYMFGLVSFVYFNDVSISWEDSLEQKISSLIEKIDIKRKKMKKMTVIKGLPMLWYVSAPVSMNLIVFGKKYLGQLNEGARASKQPVYHLIPKGDLF